jgi:hypothetical protein
MGILLWIEVNIDTGVGYAFGLESNQYRAYWVQFCSDNTFYGATRSRFYIVWLTPLV